MKMIKRAVHSLLAALVAMAIALGLSVVILIGALAGVYRGEHDRDGWVTPRF